MYTHMLCRNEDIAPSETLKHQANSKKKEENKLRFFGNILSHVTVMTPYLLQFNRNNNIEKLHSGSRKRTDSPSDDLTARAWATCG